LARWNSISPADFRCEGHRQSSDWRIGAVAVRVVTLEVTIQVVSTMLDASCAQSEAVTDLTAAVGSMGGFVELTRVHSAIGRGEAPGAAG
jgi:hypothetical protein